MGLLSFAVAMYLPWWTISISCFFVAAFIPLKSWASFLSGFLSLFILWFSLSFWINFLNRDILSHKISMLLIKTDSPILLILLTAAVGAVIGGMGALTGALLRLAIFPVKRD